MANLAVFKHPEFYNKLSEVKYLFTLELKKSISSMGYKKFLLKIIISMKIDWIKKNHTEHKYFIFFESWNKKKQQRERPCCRIRLQITKCTVWLRNEWELIKYQVLIGKMILEILFDTWKPKTKLCLSIKSREFFILDQEEVYFKIAN